MERLAAAVAAPAVVEVALAVPAAAVGLALLTGEVTAERAASRDGRPEEVGVPEAEGRRRRPGAAEESRGEAIVDMASGWRAPGVEMGARAGGWW